MPKWEDRSRVGIYLGRSKQHATNVSLILNPKTGFVSPQFHCIYDDTFESLKYDNNFSAVWAEKAGLLLKSNEQDQEEDYGQASIPDQLSVPFEVGMEDNQQEEVENADNEVSTPQHNIQEGQES